MVLCLLLGCGILISTALLGSSLSRFSQEVTNVIALVPPAELRIKTITDKSAVPSETEAEPVQSAESAGAGGTVLPRRTAAAIGNASANTGDTAATADNTKAVTGDTSAAIGNASAVTGDTAATADNTKSVTGDTSAAIDNASAAAGNTSAAIGNASADTGNTVAVTGYTTGATRYTATRSDEYQGELQVRDKALVWSSETHVDLFKDSYEDTVNGGTVKSDNSEKVITPGTSNFYTFTLDNNGNVPLDYEISLEVESFTEGKENYPEIPLEWRLLDSTSTPVSDWQGYNERREVLKQDTLEARNQKDYTIEWQWAFERGGNKDAEDTKLGNLAAGQRLGVNATIYVRAEENTDDETVTDPGDETTEPSEKTPDRPGEVPDGETPDDETPNDETPGQETPDQDGEVPEREASEEVTVEEGKTTAPWGAPQTGDAARPLLYAALFAVSVCALLILFVVNRRRKKDEDGEDDRKES